MKRIIVLLSMMLSMIAIDAMAQQVRGIETKRVVYNGVKYSYDYRNSEYSDEYYGWEFTNRNSIPVSVSIILKGKGNPDDYIVTTKEIVLNSKESYIFKPDPLVSSGDFRVHNWGSGSISDYYVVYEAYKLE